MAVDSEAAIGQTSSKLGKVRGVVGSATKLVRTGLLVAGVAAVGKQGVEYYRHPHQAIDDSAKAVRKADKAGLDLYKGIANRFPSENASSQQPASQPSAPEVAPPAPAADNQLGK